MNHESSYRSSSLKLLKRSFSLRDRSELCIFQVVSLSGSAFNRFLLRLDSVNQFKM